jgi:hypothetical protein
MASAWSTISSKVIADPPTLWCVYHSRATSVEVGSLSNAQREYTKTREKSGGKLSCAAGTLAWPRSGRRRQRARTQEVGGLPRAQEWATPLNGYNNSAINRKSRRHDRSIYAHRVLDRIPNRCRCGGGVRTSAADGEALNTPLPKAAERAILAGICSQSTVKDTTIALSHDNWPTSKGDDLKFLVCPTGQTRQ